jgi:3-methyladenine DNA glycosylase Tag
MARKKIYKPKNDDEFLGQLAFIRFVSGFRYSVVEARWPAITKAFWNFRVNKLAAATLKDVDGLMNAKGMIKNRKKIEDVIGNAIICRKIAEEHGSVLKWIAAVKTQHASDPLLSPSLGEEFRRFKGIGEMTSGWLEGLHMAKKDFIVYDAPGSGD